MSVTAKERRLRAGVPADLVHEGRDGHLFLSGGAHRTRALYSGELRPSAQSVQSFFANLRARKAFCEARGIAFQQVVFPDKMVALADWLRLPGSFTSAWLRDYHDADPLGASVTYPIARVRGQSDFFPRTDAHYSVDGMLALADEICRPYGDDLIPQITEDPESLFLHADGVNGDLGRKYHPRIPEPQRQFRPLQTPGARLRDNGLKHKNSGLMILARNPRPILDQTLLIFGDSYFRQMLPVLQRLFRHVVFCRSRFFHAELVAAVGPDVLWCGMAERYLSECKPDRDRMHFLAMAAAHGAQVDPKPGFDRLWKLMIDREKLLFPGEIEL